MKKEEILKRFQNKKKLKMVFGADIRFLIGCFFYKMFVFSFLAVFERKTNLIGSLHAILQKGALV